MQKHILLALTVLGAIAVILHLSTPLTMTEDSANFSENEKVKIRKLIQNGGQMFEKEYPVIASYLRGQMKTNWGSYWNVLVFSKDNYDYKVTLTGMYDETHQNKRYFRVLDTKPYGWSVLIYQTNNTRFDLNSVDAALQVAQTGPVALRESRNVSEYVDAVQVAGIDLALRSAYVANRGIIDFTKVFKDLISINLGQNWEVCTAYEGQPSFAFVYTSPMAQWVEYSNFGLGIQKWHVYIWRNVKA